MDYEQVEDAVDVAVSVGAVDAACADLKCLAAAWADEDSYYREGPDRVGWEGSAGSGRHAASFDIVGHEPGRFVSWTTPHGEQGWLVFEARGPDSTRIHYMGRYPTEEWHGRLGLSLDDLRTRTRDGLARLKAWLEAGQYRSGPSRT